MNNKTYYIVFIAEDGYKYAITINKSLVRFAKDKTKAIKTDNLDKAICLLKYLRYAFPTKSFDLLEVSIIDKVIDIDD